MSTLSQNNPPAKRERPTVEHLITKGLGYCCLWAFFSLFGRTSVIAARLGVTNRAVRYARSRCTNGECKCEERENCMKDKIKQILAER